MSDLPFQFKFAEAGVGMKVDREDLDELEDDIKPMPENHFDLSVIPE